MEAIGSFFDGLGRFIASVFGCAGNSASESKSFREELAKEQQRSAAEREAQEPRP